MREELLMSSFFSASYHADLKVFRIFKEVLGTFEELYPPVGRQKIDIVPYCAPAGTKNAVLNSTNDCAIFFYL